MIWLWEVFISQYSSVTNAAILLLESSTSIGGANYWFICEKPNGENPALIGEWPYYLITFQLAGSYL